jgi:hypothetical protein
MKQLETTKPNQVGCKGEKRKFSAIFRTFYRLHTKSTFRCWEEGGKWGERSGEGRELKPNHLENVYVKIFIQNLFIIEYFSHLYGVFLLKLSLNISLISNIECIILFLQYVYKILPTVFTIFLKFSLFFFILLILIIIVLSLIFFSSSHFVMLAGIEDFFPFY